MLQYNPFAIPLFIAVIPLGGILFTAWQQRATAPSRIFFVFVLLATGLVISYGMELLNTTLTGILWALRFEYIFHSCLIFWMVFAFVYSGSTVWMQRRRLLMLLIMPAVISVLVWTNDYHGLIWRVTATATHNGLVLFSREYGVMFWVWMCYLYGCSLLGSYVLLRTVIRSHVLYRSQGNLIILATVIPMVASILTIIRLTPFPDLDLVPYGVALSCIPVALALYRFHLLDIVPAAHREVFVSLREGVIICDGYSRIVDVNPMAERVLNCHVRDILGKPVAAALPEICVQSDGGTASGASETQEVQQLTRQDRMYEVSCHSLRPDGSGRSGMAYIVRDVTSRQWAEQRAVQLALEQEKVRLLSDFIKTTSHDFRTPLSSLKLSAQVLQRLSNTAKALVIGSDGVVAADVQDTFDKIDMRIGSVEDLSDQLAHLVNGMLDLLQLENQPTFEFSRQNLNVPVEREVEAFAQRIHRKGQSLAQDLAGDIPRILIDSWLIAHAVNVLLDNAHRYTPAGGHIIVSTGRRADNAYIEIADSGIGISRDEMPHIFERFYRADPARSVSAGAGLGLPIAQAIVKAHHGEIEVESQPSKGSTFRIVLPISPPDLRRNGSLPTRMPASS